MEMAGKAQWASGRVMFNRPLKEHSFVRMSLDSHDRTQVKWLQDIAMEVAIVPDTPVALLWLPYVCCVPALEPLL